MYLMIATVVILLVGVTLSYLGKRLPTHICLHQQLVQTYHKKPKHAKRVALIVEAAGCDLTTLTDFLLQVLDQTVGVDAMYLVTDNDEFGKVPLIRDTCILCKVGGVFFLLKETHVDTVLVYAFPTDVKGLADPNFLKHYLESDVSVDGMVKVAAATLTLDVGKAYANSSDA
jgi:hypothetical protein